MEIWHEHTHIAGGRMSVVFTEREWMSTLLVILRILYQFSLCSTTFGVILRFFPLGAIRGIVRFSPFELSSLWLLLLCFVATAVCWTFRQLLETPVDDNLRELSFNLFLCAFFFFFIKPLISLCALAHWSHKEGMRSLTSMLVVE
ncbi:hypothetical protein BDV32DRAFT_123197 [Aspergillus pseudonomiae]|nr:hypothetical protein BDV32DRAFT_123197 [Aspergillus pseudonomiae]